VSPILNRTMSDALRLFAGTAAVCGDGVCTQLENTVSCPADCPAFTSSCDTSSWSSALDPAGTGETWQQLESDAVARVNYFRLNGATCVTKGVTTVYPPDNPAARTRPDLVVDNSLRQAARCHSREMSNYGFLGHLSRNGETFDARLRDAGASFSSALENAAAGPKDATWAVDKGWILSTEGHCDNLMNPNMRKVGIGFGYLFAAGSHWTMDASN
jgi:uncharacterized protein YkwD